MDNKDKYHIQELEEENIKLKQENESLKERLKEKNRGIILSITNDKIKHYDNLLWTISTIFAAAIGGLLLHLESLNNFDIWYMWSSIFGFWLTVFAVYFAASFRELRFGEQPLFRELFEELKRDKGIEETKEEKGGRFFYQWFSYVLIFLILGIFWIALLVENVPFYSWLWSIMGSLGEGFMLFCWYKTRKP